MSVTPAVIKAVLALGLLSMIACADSAPSGGRLNRVDALGLDRSHADTRVQSLILTADDYYKLYTEQGSETWYQRHLWAVEGAVQVLEELQAEALLDARDASDLDQGMWRAPETDPELHMPVGRA